MPKLIATDGSQLLLQGEEVSVGRRDGGEPVDVDLGTLERGRTVSRRHARIFRKSSTWRLRVESSAMNETKVAGKSLKPGEEAALADGDEIQLGAVALTFRTDFDPEVTVVAGAQAPAELRADGMVFPLAAPEGRRLWIGRPQTGAASAADMIDLTSLSGSRSVSHRHAQIYRTPDGWRLHEGKTTNPTMVNGRALQPGEDVLLKNEDSIQLGRVRVTFHEVRAARVVTSDILLLEADQQEITIQPGLTDSVGIRLVNLTGRVEAVEVEVEGIPADWYQIAGADGTRGAKWRVQLFPSGPDVMNPPPTAVANARLMFMPPKSPLARAGQYPITIAATTQGDDRVRRVIAGRLHLLPFEGLTLALSPMEAKGAKARYTAEVVNTGNADADVELVLEPDPGLIIKAEPERLQLANGADQRAVLKARAKRHHIWGPKRTYGLHVSAVSGAQRMREGAVLVTPPIVPEWLQMVLSKLFAIFSPIAIPAATLVLLLGLAYLFLRPPEIKEFYASAPAVAAGGTVQLNWNADRAAGVTIDPPIGTRTEGGAGTVDVTPDKTTEYTLTARNWVGLSSSSKTSVSVLKILAFTASTTQLTQEGQEVALKWETDGAQTVTIDPADEIKDPKLSGDAKVHPKGNTTYTLTATGNGGVTVQQAIPINIGMPSIKRFEVSDPPSGTRVFPGGQVKLNWQADGVTSAKITVDKGDVMPGQKELDVSAGPPATVQPGASGDVQYTLTVSNAAGSQTSTVKINVSPISISKFETDPSTITSDGQSKLRWSIDGANDTTKITIDPPIGVDKLKPTDEQTIKPTDTTEYTLTATTPDGNSVQKKTTLTVQAPGPQINVFTAPTQSVTLGDQVRLTWSVQNADSIEIKTGDGFLIVQTKQAAGSVIDNPVAPTTYILTATGPSGKPVTKDFSVDVKQPAPTPAPAAPTPAPATKPAAPAAGAGPSPVPKP